VTSPLEEGTADPKADGMEEMPVHVDSSMMEWLFETLKPCSVSSVDFVPNR
jgi:hypothetical protein